MRRRTGILALTAAMVPVLGAAKPLTPPLKMTSIDSTALDAAMLHVALVGKTVGAYQIVSKLKECPATYILSPKDFSIGFTIENTKTPGIKIQLPFYLGPAGAVADAGLSSGGQIVKTAFNKIGPPHSLGWVKGQLTPEDAQSLRNAVEPVIIAWQNTYKNADGCAISPGSFAVTAQAKTTNTGTFGISLFGMAIGPSFQDAKSINHSIVINYEEKSLTKKTSGKSDNNFVAYTLPQIPVERCVDRVRMVMRECLPGDDVRVTAYEPLSLLSQ